MKRTKLFLAAAACLLLFAQSAFADLLWDPKSSTYDGTSFDSIPGFDGVGRTQGTRGVPAAGAGVTEDDLFIFGFVDSSTLPPGQGLTDIPTFDQSELGGTELAAGSELMLVFTKEASDRINFIAILADVNDTNTLNYQINDTGTEIVVNAVVPDPVESASGNASAAFGLLVSTADDDDLNYLGTMFATDFHYLDLGVALENFEGAASLNCNGVDGVEGRFVGLIPVDYLDDLGITDADDVSAFVDGIEAPPGDFENYGVLDLGFDFNRPAENPNNEVVKGVVTNDQWSARDIGFGTVASDIGAGEFALTSPVSALWNGFLNMNNILELVNKENRTLTATVTLYDISGTEVNRLSNLQIAAKGQQDIILNSLSGFTANSYGIVQVEFTGKLEGRLSFYRPDSTGSAGDDYEFAFAVPFSDSITGTSYVGFNTFQPSANPAEASDVVTNWLSIVNLDSANEKSFTVTRYGQSGGTAITTQTVNVPAFGRVDIEGGHDNPGPSFVGLNQIVPDDAAAPYMAQVVRYGAKSTGGYAFAFPLLAKAGGPTEQWVSVSAGAGAQDWVEVANVSNATEDITATFYDNSGTEVGNENLSLAGYAQQHLNATGYLPAGASGAVKIASTNAGAVIAQSMFYFRDAAGSIEAMYGKQSGPAATANVSGSYNLYLNMNSWLRVFNATGSRQTVSVNVYGEGNSVNSRQLDVGAYSGVDLGLHETGTFETAADSYGIVRVEGTGIVSEVLRIKPRTTSGTDFAFVTEGR